VPGPNGRARLVVDHLDALDEPDSLVWLRATAQTMMPRVDLELRPLRDPNARDGEDDGEF
jgi:hypothetical protein